MWAAAGDLAVGQQITPDDLTATRVGFADAGDLTRYLLVEAQLPDGLSLTRALDAGELVPAGALGEESAADTVSVSIPLAPERVPTSLVTGSRVDVWVVQEDRRARSSATVVLDDVAVLDAPRAADAFASAAGTRQVVLAVPVEAQEALSRILAASGDDLVRVVRRG